MGELEEFEDKAECVKHAAIAGYEERPEVQTTMALEGHEDLNVEFDDVVPCHCRKCCNGHVGCLVRAYQPACLSIILFRHFGGVASIFSHDLSLPPLLVEMRRRNEMIHLYRCSIRSSQFTHSLAYTYEC